MQTEIKVALVGIGGYGGNYVAGMLDAKDRSDVRLVAVVDPFPAACKRLDELLALGIPLYSSLDEMYAAHQPDLVVIASPIHVHCDQTVTALQHGSHVLCEKPLCATVEQIERMIAARDLAKRQVAIGYQWPFSTTFQTLKADISAGVMGAPVRLSTFVCWPRDNRYYGRNRWAGRQYDEAGKPVFDSPVNNACAHYLHIMLYLLGGAIDRSAATRDVTAELYRANAIENYDTAAIRCMTDVGAEIFFFVSHATPRVRGPIFKFEFEKADVTFDSSGTGEGVIARFHDGTIRKYGSASSGIGKMWKTIDAIRSGEPVCCGIEAAAAQTRVMAAAQQNEIVRFPSNLVHVQDSAGGKSLVVDGLEEVLFRCYSEHKLPGELGVSWATANVLVKTAV